MEPQPREALTNNQDDSLPPCHCKKLHRDTEQETITVQCAGISVKPCQHSYSLSQGFLSTRKKPVISPKHRYQIHTTAFDIFTSHLFQKSILMLTCPF